MSEEEVSRLWSRVSSAILALDAKSASGRILRQRLEYLRGKRDEFVALWNLDAERIRLKSVGEASLALLEEILSQGCPPDLDPSEVLLLLDHTLRAYSHSRVSLRVGATLEFELRLTQFSARAPVPLDAVCVALLSPSALEDWENDPGMLFSYNDVRVSISVVSPFGDSISGSTLLKDAVGYSWWGPNLVGYDLVSRILVENDQRIQAQAALCTQIALESASAQTERSERRLLALRSPWAAWALWAHDPSSAPLVEDAAFAFLPPRGFSWRNSPAELAGRWRAAAIQLWIARGGPPPWGGKQDKQDS